MIKLRDVYDDEEREYFSELTGLECKDVSRTQQSSAEEVDINTIVRRFGLDGQMPVNPRVPQYGDFEGIGDFQDAVHAVRTAEDDFMKLPAKIRARFYNDPQKLLEFIADGDNLKEAIDLGLVKAPEAAPAAPGAAAAAP